MKYIDLIGTQRMVHGRHGYFIYNQYDLYVGKSLEVYGEYSEHESELFSDIVKAGSMVLEIGANIGSQTVLLSRLVGDDGLVYAFEPQPLIFQNLAANISINSLKNVRVFPFACGSNNGSIHVPHVDYCQSGNFGGVSMHKSAGEQVSLVRLDSWLDTNHSISLIKIDVEGMEQDVILGLNDTINKHKPILFVENDRKEKSKQLIELLWALGYQCYWHITPLYNTNNFYNVKENIFENLVSINMVCLPSGAKGIGGTQLIYDSNEHPWH